MAEKDTDKRLLGRINRLAVKLGVTPELAAQLRIITLLEALNQNVVEPKLLEGYPEVVVYAVQVTTPGTGQQGPDITVPKGYPVVIRQRRHAVNRTGYVAFDSGDLINPIRRSELADNDFITVRVSNLKRIWFDTDTAGTYFELLVEYARDGIR